MKRLLKILEQLEKNRYVTSEVLAFTNEVSQKTIRNDINSLRDNENTNGFTISSKPRFGYQLTITDKNKYEIFKLQFNDSNVPDSSEARIAYVAMELLQSNKYYPVDRLAEKLYVSKSTIHNIIKKVDETFSSYSLKLDRKTGYGLKIVGTEEDIRQCMNDLMMRFKLSKYYENLGNREQLIKISEKLLMLLEKYTIRLSEIAYYNFLMYLFIDIERIQKGNTLSRAIVSTETETDEKRLIEELTEYIFNKFNIAFSTIEKQSLTFKLMGFRTSTDFNSEVYVNEEIHQLASDMLKLVDHEFNINFSKDFELKMNLIRHLVPMTIRIQFGITTLNPLSETIKDKYSFAYMIAKYSCKLLESKYKKAVSDDEVSYLALIYSLSLEKERKENPEKKNIVLVCGSSIGSAYLLKYKYQSEFQNYLNEVSTCSLSELDSLDLDKVDYIFSTVPIMKKMKVPIIQVGYFLDDEDIKKVTTVFSATKTNILKDYYKPDQFIVGLDVDTQDEAIKQIFDIAKTKYKLTKDFYDSMVTREFLAKTAFGNSVAMPHTVETISKETFAYVIILKKPIMWGDQEVQLLFFTNIGKMRGENLVHFYDLTMRFIMDKNLVDSLLQEQTFDHFMGIIHNLDQTK